MTQIKSTYQEACKKLTHITLN